MFGKTQLYKNRLDFCKKYISNSKLPLELMILILGYLQEVKIIKYDFSGHKTSEIQLLNGKKHGWHVNWYENYLLKNKQFYMYGCKVGKVEGYHVNGKKEYIHRYINGKKHGKNVGFHNNGKILYVINYSNGLKHGFSTFWYKNGKKEYKLKYKNGKRHGLCKWWCIYGTEERRGYLNGVNRYIILQMKYNNIYCNSINK